MNELTMSVDSVMRKLKQDKRIKNGKGAFKMRFLR